MQIGGHVTKHSLIQSYYFTVFFPKQVTSASGKQVYREFKGFQVSMKKRSEETSRSVSGHGNEQIFLDLKVKAKPS